MGLVQKGQLKGAPRVPITGVPKGTALKPTYLRPVGTPSSGKGGPPSSHNLGKGGGKSQYVKAGQAAAPPRRAVGVPAAKLLPPPRQPSRQPLVLPRGAAGSGGKGTFVKSPAVVTPQSAAPLFTRVSRVGRGPVPSSSAPQLPAGRPPSASGTRSAGGVPPPARRATPPTREPTVLKQLYPLARPPPPIGSAVPRRESAAVAGAAPAGGGAEPRLRLRSPGRARAVPTTRGPASAVRGKALAPTRRAAAPSAAASASSTARAPLLARATGRSRVGRRHASSRTGEDPSTDLGASSASGFEVPRYPPPRVVGVPAPKVKAGAKSSLGGFAARVAARASARRDGQEGGDGHRGEGRRAGDRGYDERRDDRRGDWSRGDSSQGDSAKGVGRGERGERRRRRRDRGRGRYSLWGSDKVRADGDKGKGGRKGERRKGHKLPRTRISEAPMVGEVVEWMGKFGWVQPDEPIDHPLAQKHGGRLFVSVLDIQDGATELIPGSICTFMVFSDASGLGAEEVIVDNES